METTAECGDDDDDNVATVVKVDEKLKSKSWVAIYRMSARYSLAKNPSWLNVTPQALQDFHGAYDFVNHVRKYISEKYPYAPYLPISSDTFHVFKRIYISLKPLNGFEDTIRKDVVRATPSRGDSKKRDRFDTVLVHEDNRAETVGVEGELAVFRV